MGCPYKKYSLVLSDISNFGYTCLVLLNQFKRKYRILWINSAV